MEMKSVSLIGAGAVGSYFIWGFSRVPDIRFSVIAEGERRERLMKNGIVINGEPYRPDVRTPEEARGADLLLICTKDYGLGGAMDAIARATGENTAVMSLLNGVTSEEEIASRIGAEHLIWSVMRINSERTENGVKFDPEITGGVTLGERDTPEATPRVKAVAALFERAGIRCRILPDIIRDQWGKLAVNVCYNLPQAVLGVGYGAYFSSEHVAFLRDRLFDEVKAVGAARGIDVPPLNLTPATSVPEARFSTLQDLDAKRQTEVELFLGGLMKMAAGAGIGVPFMEYTYHAIRALEEKNAGLI